MPLPVKRALTKLGSDIKSARLRRRIPATVMAERAFITRMTLAKAEKGDAGVSLGIYATILFVLGMTNRLAELADVTTDEVGLQLQDEQLPTRVRSQRNKRSA
jgi:transcriptional regulator with XRE-family HTH domain